MKIADARGFSKTRLCDTAGTHYHMLNATVRSKGLSSNSLGLLINALEKVAPLTPEEEHLIVTAIKETPGVMQSEEYRNILYDRNGKQTRAAIPQPPTGTPTPNEEAP